MSKTLETGEGSGHAAGSVDGHASTSWGSFLRTPALKTEKIGRFSKKATKDLLKRSCPYFFPGFLVQGMVLVNPFSVLLKRPIFY